MMWLDAVQNRMYHLTGPDLGFTSPEFYALGWVIAFLCPLGILYFIYLGKKEARRKKEALDESRESGNRT